MSINRNVLIVVLFLQAGLLNAVLMAQEEEWSMIISAKVWGFSGDTTDCNVQYNNPFNLQFNLTRVDTGGRAIAYYTPKDIAGFSYEMSNEEIVFVSVPNPDGMGRIFLRLMYQGEYTLYQYLEINYKSTVLTFLVSYYLWKKDWLLPPITQKYETESLLYHFRGCPELEFKIKSGIYGLPEIRHILNEYEKCKLTDKYEYFFE